MGLIRMFLYGLVFSGAGWLGLKVIEFTDLYKVVHKNVPGPCSFVGGVEHGSEDIAVLPNGLAIFSTGLQFDFHTSDKKAEQDPSSGFMTFDFTSPKTAAKKLTISGFKGILNPHGLSLSTEGGKTYVYFVNHPPGNVPPPADVVEKFLWNVEKQTLVYQKTFSDPEFLGLNDLVVVGVDKFYVTNLMTMTSKAMRQLETLAFLAPLQNVVYFDGKNGTLVIRGLNGPNGIDISADKKYLFVAETNKKRVSSYRIEDPTTLTLADTKVVGSIVDNIVVSPETGDLWIGAHPVGHEVFAYMFGYAKQAPSQVLRVSVKDGKFAGVAEIYADDGSVLSGSSVAAPFKDSVLIGTVKHKLLHCRLTGMNSIMKLA